MPSSQQRLDFAQTHDADGQVALKNTVENSDEDLDKAHDLYSDHKQDSNSENDKDLDPGVQDVLVDNFFQETDYSIAASSATLGKKEKISRQTNIPAKKTKASERN